MLCFNVMIVLCFLFFVDRFAFLYKIHDLSCNVLNMVMLFMAHDLSFNVANGLKDGDAFCGSGLIASML